MDIIYLISGFVAGGLLTWLLFYFYTKSKFPYSKEELQNIEDQNKELEVNLKLAEGKLSGQQEELVALRTELVLEREKSQKFFNIEQNWLAILNK